MEKQEELLKSLKDRKKILEENRKLASVPKQYLERRQQLVSFGAAHKLIKQGRSIPNGDPSKVAQQLKADQENEFQLLKVKNERLELEIKHLNEQVKQQDDDFKVSDVLEVELKDLKEQKV